MASLAACPNAAVKISGLGNVEHKREVVLDAIELFGTGRALFASNFPVDGLRATFDQVYSTFNNSPFRFRKAKGGGFSTITPCAFIEWSNMKFSIGYVGVGLMGGPMVKRLTSLGWKVRLRHRARALDGRLDR